MLKYYLVNILKIKEIFNIPLRYKKSNFILPMFSILKSNLKSETCFFVSLTFPFCVTTLITLSWQITIASLSSCCTLTMFKFSRLGITVAVPSISWSSSEWNQLAPKIYKTVFFSKIWHKFVTCDHHQYLLYIYYIFTNSDMWHDKKNNQLGHQVDFLTSFLNYNIDVNHEIIF